MITDKHNAPVSTSRPGWFFGIRQRLGNPKLKAFLAIVLAIDLFFLCCHLLNTYGVALVQPAWNLGTDRGYSEWFQYAKLTGIIASLGILAFNSRSRLYSAFTFFFGLVLLDDSLEIHEQVGDRIAIALNTGENFGELIFLAAMGLVAIAPILFYYHTASNSEEKNFSLDIVKLLVVFGISGIAIDFIDSEIYFSTRFFRYLFGTLEDFGENVAISFILAIAIGALTLYLNRKPDKPLP